MKLPIICLTALALTACQEDSSDPDDGGTLQFDAQAADAGGAGGEAGENVVIGGPSPEPEAEPSCSADDFADDAIAFCRSQAVGTPDPRTLGARCQGDGQCESGNCYGDECVIECPRGDECPQGFLCQDVDRAQPVCRSTICIYGADSFDDCLRAINAELDAACEVGVDPGCPDAARAWLGCLNDNGRFCSSEEAGEACGVERVQLERCCFGCDEFSW